MYDALLDFVPFEQFRKHEKHPWKSVTFSKVVGFNNPSFLTPSSSSNKKTICKKHCKN